MLRFETAFTDPYREPAFFQGALSRLPWPEKRDRILRYRREEDRRRSLAAWSLAAEMLRAEGMRDPELDYTQAGKPALVHYPDLYFNLSHGGDLAVCAVSDRPVGADVEPLLTAEPDLAAYAFSDEERRWLAEQPDASEAFTRLWVRKESYLKCVGTGLSYPLQELSLQPGREEEAGCRFIEKEIRGHRISICSLL
nr:4'-phosphopantetheinyl transferase superfamily protein [Lachnospiraceae bacterium]